MKPLFGLVTALTLIGCEPDIVLDLLDPPDPPAPVGFVSVHTVGTSGSGRDYMFCGLKDDGHVVCWWRNGPLPAPPGRFSQIDLGRDAAAEAMGCGITLEGAVTCWGPGACPDAAHCRAWGPEADYHAQSNPPYVSVSVGENVVCALNVAGEATCSGLNNLDQAEPPSPLTSLAMGLGLGCGLRPGGNAVCWGRRAPFVPANAVFERVFSNGEAMCGLTQGGALRCRGNRVEEVAEDPHPRGYIDVAMHFQSVCALNADGEVECWDTYSRNNVDYGPGPFIGLAHTSNDGCALREDGVIECFGVLEHSGPVPCEIGQEKPCFVGPGTPGVGSCRAGTTTCLGDVWSACEDQVVAVRPAICNGLDDECLGEVDLVFRVGRACRGAGRCGAGVRECGDEWPTRCSTEPGGTQDQSRAERCDGVDDDCDARVDEDCQAPCDPEVEDCCLRAGSGWRRPGGFWHELAGHQPNWRPTFDWVCQDLEQDECGRPLSSYHPCEVCVPGECENCRIDLDICRVSESSAYDAFGSIQQESVTTTQRESDESNFVITHTYDEVGARTATWGRVSPDDPAELTAALQIRYLNDAQGRVVREEAMYGEDDFIEVRPPVEVWVPTRISTFEYIEDGILERIDLDGNGTFDELRQH